MGLISWKTHASPSISLCATANPCHPPLKAVLPAKYLVSNSSPCSSTRVTVQSYLGRWLVQNCFIRPWRMVNRWLNYLIIVSVPYQSGLIPISIFNQKDIRKKKGDLFGHIFCTVSCQLGVPAGFPSNTKIHHFGSVLPEIWIITVSKVASFIQNWICDYIQTKIL